MKITDLKLYYIPYRFLYLKVETDEGISGWGEPIVEGRAQTVEAAVNEWKPFLIGQDPLQIEKIWQTMYRCAFYRGGAVMMSTMAGINQALWDIKGKFYGMPIYEMLGGAVKDRVKVYRGIEGDTPELLADAARQAVKDGYRIVKCCPNVTAGFIDSHDKIDHVESFVSAVHDAVGDVCDVAIDFHGRLHKSMAKQMVKRLDQYNLTFIEEPVLPENWDVMKQITSWSSTPIATGERMYSRWDFKKVFEQGTVDIVQPDLSHAGGISECMRIAHMAEAYDVALAPHCPLSTIAFASCIQVDAACENAVFQEQQINIHEAATGSGFFKTLKDPDVFKFKDGYITPPKAPGLGIEVDEDVVRELSVEGHNWHNPITYTEDGTPMEW